MLRATATLALTLCLAGCGPVTLLTGGSSGCSLDPVPILHGLLLASAQSGTALKVERVDNGTVDPGASPVPIMWPTGYTGRRLLSGEVEVLDESGRLVATTGKRYTIGERPPYNFDTKGAFPACDRVGELP